MSNAIVGRKVSVSYSDMNKARDSAYSDPLRGPIARLSTPSVVIDGAVLVTGAHATREVKLFVQEFDLGRERCNSVSNVYLIDTGDRLSQWVDRWIKFEKGTQFSFIINRDDEGNLKAVID